MSDVSITVYTREDCQLCEEATRQSSEVADDEGAAVELDLVTSTRTRTSARIRGARALRLRRRADRRSSSASPTDVGEKLTAARGVSDDRPSVAAPTAI